ncbi:MAG TPA: ABC transporter permease [Isosphaeraceae bacterium]|jgi:ABC-type nickel/cobalt efflux system permease component RcnA|nr:ABC transporter permease [Isosphaeraceae bacterium]
MRIVAAAVIVSVAGLGTTARGHDIPNAQVDRSIQATVRPGRLEVEYEVSLAELTLARDLRSLNGALPEGDRRALFERYGEVTGPLNAKGLLVAADGKEVALRCTGYDLVIEGHPRYTFRLVGPLPGRGKLSIRDTNFASSEGTSRLAIRGRDGAIVRGDELPEDVGEIPTRPVWMLSDEEEGRTKAVVVTFNAPTAIVGRPAVVPGSKAKPGPGPKPAPAPARLGPTSGRLSALLDRLEGVSWAWLGLLAVGLGAAHAIQPGHGKTLVAAATLGGRGSWARGVALALIVTATHMAGVLLVAVGLWLTQSRRYAEINATLARAAGFTIAAIGLWRLGRHLAGLGEHDGPGAGSVGTRGLVGLGVAGGIVPCWDAVLLVVVAEAIGRLSLGVALVGAFSLGMAAVLVAVGLVTARLGRLVVDRDGGRRWERRLGIAGGIILGLIGFYLIYY